MADAHLELNVHLLCLHMPPAGVPSAPTIATSHTRGPVHGGGGVLREGGAGHLAPGAILVQCLEPPLVVHVVPLQADNTHRQQLHGPADMAQHVNKSKCM
eukprot:772193-Pelagomonas_calceolata.AAC.4